MCIICTKIQCALDTFLLLSIWLFGWEEDTRDYELNGEVRKRIPTETKIIHAHI
jgi:hypothetical protein